MQTQGVVKMYKMTTNRWMLLLDAVVRMRGTFFRYHVDDDIKALMSARQRYTIARRMNREEFKHPEMTIQVWIIIMCVCPANILALWW